MTDSNDSAVEITYCYPCWTFPGHEAYDGWYLKGETPSEAIDYMFSHPELYKLDDDVIPGDDDMIFRGHVFEVKWPIPFDRLTVTDGWDGYPGDTDVGTGITLSPWSDNCMIVNECDRWEFRFVWWWTDKQEATDIIVDFIRKWVYDNFPGRSCGVEGYYEFMESIDN